MADTQERVEHFVMEYGAREPLIDLLRSFVEECCDAATKYEGEWQFVVIADNIRRHFDWLEENVNG